MRKRKLPYVLVIVSLGITILQACTQGKSGVPVIPKVTDPIPVKVMSLKKSTDSPVIVASGKLTTDDETLLGFKIGGVVKNIYVNEGDPVKKGQVLATLDQAEIDALVAQAELNFTKAKRDFQRVENLYRDSVTTLEQLQNSQTALDIAREQLATAQFNKRYAVIRAPENGFVLKKFMNAGQVVGIGDPVVMTNGASKKNWILKVGVSDKQWASLKGNEKATVMLDAFPEQILPATVKRKSETVDPLTGLFSIELMLKANDIKLAAGMFGKATIQTNEVTQFWSVPYEAVLDASGNEGFVFVTQEGKTARKQAVTIQAFNGSHIAISNGLDDTDVLIVSGSAYLSDNAPITIVHN